MGLCGLAEFEALDRGDQVVLVTYAIEEAKLAGATMVEDQDPR